jgi:hypothetical protein
MTKEKLSAEQTEESVVSVMEANEETEKSEKLFRSLALGSETKTYNKEVDGFDLMVVYKTPTLKQKETSDAMYSKTFNRLLQDDDYLTTREILNRAKRRGLWGNKEELRLGVLDDEIIAEKEKFKEATGKKADKFEKALAELRAEKLQLVYDLGQLVSTSVENIAEKARNEYMVLSCTFSLDDDGKESPLYESKEKLDAETDLDKLERIMLDAKTFWGGGGFSDFLHLDDSQETP